jgi:hypothetical protein
MLQKQQQKFANFDVSLTVHLSITLDNYQLHAQIFNTFITLLYMYMFRAISCSSSGGQIVLTQHLVSSRSVSDRPVHRSRKKKLQVVQAIMMATLIEGNFFTLAN